jgi:hypothetical protein
MPVWVWSEIMFFFKKKQITVDCFTDIISVYNHAKIDYSNKFFPDWWKNMPNEYTRIEKNIEVAQSTLKRCNGFIDLHKQGFTIPLWSDLVIKTYDNGKFEHLYSDIVNPLPLVQHDERMMGPEFNNFIHIKLVSPWLMKEKTGTKFFLSSSMWESPSLLPKIHIMPGVLNFKDQVQNNINTFVSKANNTIKLNFKQPLIQLVPLTDQEVKIKCHLISREEWQKILIEKNMTVSFQNGYKKIKAAETESKCPFGFK